MTCYQKTAKDCALPSASVKRILKFVLKTEQNGIEGGGFGKKRIFSENGTRKPTGG
jgi:hypothetical protein